MKKLSALFAITILVVGLGFYRGWFAFSRSAPDAGSNKVSITLDADPDKMKQDAKIVTDRAYQLTGGVTERRQGGRSGKRHREAGMNFRERKTRSPIQRH